jgi:hypothetical protein
MRRGLFHRSTVFVLAGLVGLALSLSCGDIAEDELACEQGAARLEACCPQINPVRINCRNQPGCNGNLAPVLNERASTCLTEASCADLGERGICDGLRQLLFVPYQFQSRPALEAEACR